MEKQTIPSSPARPTMADFNEPYEFIREMIAYLKASDAQFSILSATRSLRKISPTLVSLILKGQRQLTLDRVDEFSKLLKLSAPEKAYFRKWIGHRHLSKPEVFTKPTLSKNRKEVSTHILSDWIHVYVKDCFEIPSVQKDPSLVFRQLANLASPARIEKSIRFLLKEGHLRKTLSGEIVTETPLTVTDPQVPSSKIRQFHKGALSIAKAALDTHPANERYANTMILSMDAEKYQELVSVIQEFAEKLKDFAAQSSGPQLYQVIVNLSPTGGKFE
jgi:uncharacterized protein (TIGR02147 family)